MVSAGERKPVPDREFMTHGNKAGFRRRAVGADRDTLATGTDIADLRADLAALRADICRALWIQGAGLVAVMAAFKLFG